MNELGFEARKLTFDDLSAQPKCYQNEIDNNAKVLMQQTYGMLFVNGPDEKPIYYFRNSNLDSFRWAGFVELGDGPLAPQKSAHHTDIAQQDTPASGYRLVDGGTAYMFGSSEPFSEFRFFEGGATWKESDILNVSVEPFPMAFVTHFNTSRHTLLWDQPCIITGTYEGKKVVGLGAYDRGFAPMGGVKKALKESFTYISSFYSGIREDGRKECMNASLSPQNGIGLAYYWLEGEQPVLTDEVYLDAEWYHLPYAEGDPTVVYKDCTWRFAGKAVHFTGKWGSKGFTATPRLDRLGQSHVFGTFHEGDTPYKHKLFHTFNENMDCIDSRITAMNFKVY